LAEGILQLFIFNAFAVTIAMSDYSSNRGTCTTDLNFLLS